jgi:hypothetical protein
MPETPRGHGPDAGDDDARRLAALTQLFAELGAPAPEEWARTQLGQGIPQLARFLFLRAAWTNVLADGDTAWIDPTIAAAGARPDAPFAGVGAALARLRAAGARDEDVSEVARGMQAATLFALCRLLEGAPPAEPEVADVRWALVQVSPEGEVLGAIPALHASVLETDPTGREMRSREGGA